MYLSKGLVLFATIFYIIPRYVEYVGIGTHGKRLKIRFKMLLRFKCYWRQCQWY